MSELDAFDLVREETYHGDEPQSMFVYEAPVNASDYWERLDDAGFETAIKSRDTLYGHINSIQENVKMHNAMADSDVSGWWNGVKGLSLSPGVSDDYTKGQVRVSTDAELTTNAEEYLKEGVTAVMDSDNGLFDEDMEPEYAWDDGVLEIR